MQLLARRPADDRPSSALASNALSGGSSGKKTKAASTRALNAQIDTRAQGEKLTGVSQAINVRDSIPRSVHYINNEGKKQNKQINTIS